MSRNRSGQKLIYDDDYVDYDEDDYYSEEDSGPYSDCHEYKYPQNSSVFGHSASVTVGGDNPVRLAVQKNSFNGSEEFQAETSKNGHLRVEAEESVSARNTSVQHMNAEQDCLSPKTASTEQLDLPNMNDLNLTGRKEKVPLDKIASKSNVGAITKKLTMGIVQTGTGQARKPKKCRDMLKPALNLVIVGHVDAGKSTLVGHLLYQCGKVDEKIMRKYKQESARTGKGSFAFAWVLDGTKEERERGVTMDVARTGFETEHRSIFLLDTPGHRDFIPSMITGAAQADAGLLIINSTLGEFEAGFDLGGQTREHAILLRSLGLVQLLVAINKLDTVDWSQQRYDELCEIIKKFLVKQTGFIKVEFVPVSGLDGINLIEKPSADHPLNKWYNGSTLLQLIDQLDAPKYAEDQPFRAVINDVLKMTSASLSVSSKVEAGFIENGEKLYIMPNSIPVVVKGISSEGTPNDDICYAGDQVCINLSLTSQIESDSIFSGNVLCRVAECLVPGRKFSVRVVIFNVTVPIIKGSKFELFVHSLCEPCTVERLVASLNKITGEVIKKRPRCLTRNMSGIIEIMTDRLISVEPYSICKAMGRITLRSGGQTIGAGIIEETIE